jgi:ribosomal protein S18 acetylase RimI-like enzyme
MRGIPSGVNAVIEDSVLNGLVLLAIIVAVITLLARSLFNSKRWKDFNDGKKKAPTFIEIPWVIFFLYTLYNFGSAGPVGLVLAGFLALSLRVVLVMIYDKFNPDWETDGTEVGIPGLKEAVDVLNRYEPQVILGRMWGDLMDQWEKMGRAVTIKPSDRGDLQAILEMYRFASALQQEKGMVVWPDISPSLIQQEIEEQRQWKMVIDGQLACVWVVAFDDPLIWGEKNKDPAIYLHRIATAPDFRGQGLVEFVVKAAVDIACKMRLDFIRLDTVGVNPGLIEHYTNHGFTYLGAFQLKSTQGLPGHYNDGPVLLFERAVNWLLYVPQTREELEKFTVKELKKMLKLREMPTSGNKTELIDRLLEASQQRYEV